jgi:hypothetical protein
MCCEKQFKNNFILISKFSRPLIGWFAGSEESCT